MKENHKIIVVAIFACLLASAVGYAYGFQAGIRWSIKIGSYFVDFNIDEQMLATAIWQYRENIGGCFIKENAPIPIDERD